MPHKDNDVQAIVQRQIEQAKQWRDEYLDPVQAKATDYYLRRPFGNEQEGRSRVVTSELLEAVLTIMPSLMRVFFGSERVVEFKPYGPEDVDTADQQTDYINYVFSEDNPGFLTAYSAFKDALVRLFGVVKWWWEDAEEVVGSEHTGLTQDQVMVLAEDPDIRDLEVVEGDTPDLFDVSVRRVRSNGRVRVEAVPPEEFLFSPSARSLKDARMVGHVRNVSADYLISLGIDPEVVDAAKGGSDDDALVSQDDLKAARRIDRDDQTFTEDEGDEATREVLFAEIYTRLAVEVKDDDEEAAVGRTELRKVWAIGDDHEVVLNEPANDAPFAMFMVDPEPHTIVGLDIAHRVMDLQLIKSAILRGLLDSLTLSLNPATEVTDGEVNMKDVLNPEVGRIIRVRKPGQMREVITPFVGKEALPVLEYLDEVGDDRVGARSPGLDADSLQSSTKAAVTAAVQASQQQLELIARMLAETGMKDMFKGLLRLVVQHQDEPRTVRLRNEFVRVDPRQWDADKDVVVNTALGTGLVEEKLVLLGEIAAKQEQLLLNGAPIASWSKYRNTLGRMAELAGFRNSQEFFPQFGPEEEAAFQQAQAQAPKPPSDTEVLLQIEMAKIQAKSAEEQGKLQVKVAELQLEREKIAGELAIKAGQLAEKEQADRAKAALEEQRLRLDRETSAIDALGTLSKTRVGDDA